MKKNEINTGIWEITRPSFTGHSEFFDYMKERILGGRNPHNLSTICADAEQFARYYIEMNERGEWFETERDIKSKRHNRDQALKQLNERKQHMLRVAERIIHQVASLRETVETGRTPRAAVLAFWLGSNYEKLRILPHERFSAAAKRSQVGANKIAKLRSKKAKASLPDFQRLLTEEIELQKRTNKKIVVDKALAVVAANTGVSKDVVRRNTKNVWTARPRNKK